MVPRVYVNELKKFFFNPGERWSESYCKGKHQNDKKVKFSYWDLCVCV